MGQRRRFLILPLQAGTTGAAGTTTRNTASIATGTANLFKFNDNDCITSKNPDRIVVALRKLPVPVYQTKRSIPNPLICVQSSSLLLKQDLTKQSCANLVKRIRNPLGVCSVMPVRDDTLNNRQRSMLAAASQSDWTARKPACGIFLF